MARAPRWRCRPATARSQPTAHLAWPAPHPAPAQRRARAPTPHPAPRKTVKSVQSVNSVTHLHVRDHLDHLGAGTGQTPDHLALCHDHHDHLAPLQPRRWRHSTRRPASLGKPSILSEVSKVSPICMRLAILAIFRPDLGKRVAILLPSLAPLATLPPRPGNRPTTRPTQAPPQETPARPIPQRIRRARFCNAAGSLYNAFG
jgi:hypothetical protein